MDGSFLKRTLIALALILVGWAMFVSWQQIERHRKIEKEVAELQAEAEKIKRENETFSERISYFSSDAFREQEAKKKLGLKKANESVVVIKPTAAAEGPVPEPSLPKKQTAMVVGPNYEKWWQLFFE